MNIYLVRHGQTVENIKHTYYGAMDAELTQRGIGQAKAVGKRLKKIKFDKVFCSEKKRARETLKYIYQGEYTVDRRINERNFGIFEGLTYKEIEEVHPDEFAKWISDWKNSEIKDGESYSEFYNRVQKFMEELKGCAYDNVLICAHEGVMKSIFVYVLGGDYDLYWRFASKNGDIAIVKYEYGNFYIDSITHLDDKEVVE